MAAGLIDRHRLLVFPVALGTGARLFADPAMASAYKLESCETTAAGISSSPIGRRASRDRDRSPRLRSRARVDC